jgi:uncharacterized protein (DUF2062 family)
MTWLIQQFGSKKLVAMIAAILAILAVPILNSKLGLNLTANEITTVIVSVLTPALGYIIAQWHIDVKTNGATTTASIVAQKLAQAAGAALPEQTLGAKIAKAIDEVLSADLSTAVLPTPPAPPSPPVAPPQG